MAASEAAASWSSFDSTVRKRKKKQKNGSFYIYLWITGSQRAHTPGHMCTYTLCPRGRIGLLFGRCIIRTGLTWSAVHSWAGHTQTQAFPSAASPLMTRLFSHALHTHTDTRIPCSRPPPFLAWHTHACACPALNHRCSVHAGRSGAGDPFAAEAAGADESVFHEETFMAVIKCGWQTLRQDNRSEPSFYVGHRSKTKLECVCSCVCVWGPFLCIRSATVCQSGVNIWKAIMLPGAPRFKGQPRDPAVQWLIPKLTVLHVGQSAADLAIWPDDGQNGIITPYETRFPELSSVRAWMQRRVWKGFGLVSRKSTGSVSKVPRCYLSYLYLEPPSRTPARTNCTSGKILPQLLDVSACVNDINTS